MSEGIRGAQIEVIAPAVGRFLIEVVRKKPPPFQSEHYIGRQVIHHVAHVALILGTASRKQIGKRWRVNAVGEIRLPLFGEVRLNLQPSTSRPNAMVARS